MIMDIKYIEKKMEKIIPKGVSLLEFMTARYIAPLSI